MVISDLVRVNKGKLRAFFTVEWPNKLRIRDCKLLEGEDGNLYALMPSKQYADRGGHQRWSPVVEILDIKTLNKISEAARKVYAE